MEKIAAEIKKNKLINEKELKEKKAEREQLKKKLDAQVAENKQQILNNEGSAKEKIIIAEEFTKLKKQEE